MGDKANGNALVLDPWLIFSWGKETGTASDVLWGSGEPISCDILYYPSVTELFWIYNFTAQEA